MSGLEVGQVVTATLPDAARRLGLPGEVTGPVIRLEQEGDGWFVCVEVREPALQDEVAAARARAIASGSFPASSPRRPPAGGADHEMIGARCLVDVGGCGSRWCGTQLALRLHPECPFCGHRPNDQRRGTPR